MAESLHHVEKNHEVISSLVDVNSIQNLIDDELNNPIPLKSAFDIFNDLSTKLTQSYTLLEDRVSDLTSELNTVSAQRIQELKDKEQVAKRLENLINFLPAGVVVLDHRGLIAEINPAAENMLEPNLKGRLWREVITRCFFPKSDDGYEVSNHQGRRINIATRSLEQDGQIILLTDQSETRRLQSELSRHERLTALGKMVSTLAHQVRTPLSSAMLYANHLLNEELSHQQHEQFTQKLVNRLHEMERQVRDMLLFVKSDMPLNDQISISQLYHYLLEAMEMSIHQYTINCTWQVDGEDSVIRCNKDALIGAVLNLTNNSLQSMQEQGHLHITLAPKDAEYLLIEVVDDGEGIADDIKDKVNELFYTTKSQGTGIGLTVVNTVAKAHGGQLQLSPNATQGVSATLELPIIHR